MAKPIYSNSSVPESSLSPLLSFNPCAVPELQFILDDSIRIVDEKVPLLQAFGKRHERDVILPLVVLTYDLFGRTAHFDNNFYVQLNRGLCRGHKPELQNWRPYVSLLSRILYNLPCTAPVTVYRGSPNLQWFIDPAYGTGNVVIWPGFTFTTTSEPIARGLAETNGVVLKIELTSTGRDISSYSAFNNNGDGDGGDVKEIVLGPNAKLKVISALAFDLEDGFWVLKLSDEVS